MSSQIIALYNFKGGVGKTTSAYFISKIMAENKKVLLIDADPQCNLSSLLGTGDKQSASGNVDFYKFLVNIIHHREVELNFPVESKNFHYLPGNYDMIELESNSRFIEFGESIISELLNSLKKRYDVIIFDCPSYFGKTVRYILSNVDHVIIPMTPDIYSIKGLIKMIKKIRKTISAKPLLFAGAFFTRYRRDFKYHVKVKNLSRRVFKSLFLSQTIRNSVSVYDVINSKEGIESNTSNKVLNDYYQLVKQLENRLKKIDNFSSVRKVAVESVD